MLIQAMCIQNKVKQLVHDKNFMDAMCVFDAKYAVVHSSMYMVIYGLDQGVQVCNQVEQ